ncbi:MAG: topoisomerase [Candidatus Saccharibacteria bacterium]|nr:topoisomerase [Candidatus Saccharibacteria bacterium]
MAKNLVIVESPAKAKTIEKYLGSDFHVLSSIGHIRSIVKKTKDGTPPIDVKNGFETTYEVDPEKKKVITELKKAAKEATTVWLATDEDREGEAIAWHLCEVLKLDPKTTNRIVFHEITKGAIEEAVKKPRTVDMNIVQAQQARQILDRIVGFELSPVVWQKVPGGKSAGRVQSPAVRLLVEREREIGKFDSSFSFKVVALFMHEGEEVKAELPKNFKTEAEAQKFLESLSGADFSVTNVETSPGTRNPAAPFTTSTLQQGANSRLGFGSKATMMSAQKLYQEGKITYMRTDSVNLSGQAIAAAKDYITGKYGPEYSQVRNFKTKSAGAQEAHEAIRPTDMATEKGSSNEYDQKLYDLIRRRALASQMAPAKLEKTTITIAISTSKDIFEAKGEVILFAGFLKVYGTSKKEDDILPAVHSGDALQLSEASAKQTFARPPARYTEGALVKKLEELGIGRPSTYATIIDTIQTRGYVIRGEGEGVERELIVLSLKKGDIVREVVTEKTGADRGKLVPTPSGELIADFLGEHFDQVVDYDFTADVEKKFDLIADDKLARNDMLSEFYGPFHKLIEGSGGIDRSTVGANREIGKDPKSGKPILARFGRFGPMLQLGDPEDKEEKPQFAPLPAGKKIETITLEEALYAFKLPRVVGQTADGKDIKANVGRFGPYIQIDKLFVSIGKEDPHDITLEKSLELYAAKLKTEAEKNIADFGDGIKVLNGRFGPYITDGKKNAKIPKDLDPKKITHEEAKKILNEAPTTKKRFPRRK